MTNKNYRLDELLTPKQAADFIRTAQSNIYYWMDKGKVEVVVKEEYRFMVKEEAVLIRKERGLR